MTLIYDPVQLKPPKLREFAIITAWISTVAAAERDLEDLIGDLPPEERQLPDFSTPWPWDFDSFVVALSVIHETRHVSEQELEELVAIWLAEDPEHWPVLRLMLLDPWQERPGSWADDTPDWVRTLGAIAASAHEKYDPFGRRPPE